MSDTERVRAWRQRLKDNGLVPMTIWVKAETKARYEDLALQSHHSASELAQLALDAYRLDPALVSSTVTDIEQIRAIVREELDEAMAIITATITAIVTDTARETLPALVEATLQRYETDTVPDTETGSCTSSVRLIRRPEIGVKYLSFTTCARRGFYHGLRAVFLSASADRPSVAMLYAPLGVAK